MTAIPFVFPLANGLHARPASLLQEACQRFDAVFVFRNQRNRRRADVGSVLELVGTGTGAGDPCLLEVSGPQEKEAARALRLFLSREMPHGDDAAPAAAPDASASEWLPPSFHEGSSRLYRGRALAPGLGRGRVTRLKRTRALPARFAAKRKDPQLELRLFREALAKAQEEWRRLAALPGSTVGAAILRAQLAILSDPKFHGTISRLIATRKLSAGEAITRAAATLAAELQHSPSAYLCERANDIREIAARLGELVYGGAADAALPALSAATILLADHLSPAGLLSLDRRRLRGLVLGDVGFFSHVAILARSLAVPAVTIAPALLAGIGANEELIVDGRRGLAVSRPGAALKRYYRLEAESGARRQQRQAEALRRPAQTGDGVRIEIAANVGSAAELEPAWRNGAEAIGLFRSEMLFLDRELPPGEDEQYAVYSQALLSAKGRPVIIRTLDVGGDKHLPYLRLPREENPFLGVRAVRFYGEHEELVRSQLRALLRAAAHGRRGRLRIMVPMVTGVAEVALVRRLLAEAAAELRRRRVRHARRIELGIMVETPAAALAIDLLARVSDFFSIGSNDLLQYVMAVDRGNVALAGLYDPLHPAFLRLLQHAARQARKAKRWLGICGEMAGNREYLPLLVGCGFDELSMAPTLIPVARESLAQLDSGECRDVLRRALRCADAGAVAALLGEFNSRNSNGAPAAVAAQLVRLDSASRTPGEAIKELCDMLELDHRIADASVLEKAVWKREETYATDLGLGFALPHSKSSTVRTPSVAFLRPAGAIRWTGKGRARVRGVLLIAVPEGGGEEHLRLIAGLSRRLMHEDFREALLAAKNAATVVALVNGCVHSTS